MTAGLVLLQLLSLRLNLLRPFFFDTLHADVQGIDFFSLPKAWLNLRQGRSLYATFDPPAYGPHFTWYLAHPALAIALGGPFSLLAPLDSYGAFTLLSFALLGLCAWFLTRETPNRIKRALLWLLLLGSFPGYLMLWVGNVQAFTVLGLTLLLVALLRLHRGQPHAASLGRAGLLLSLLTKPVVLPALPLLLLLRETRRWAAQALAVYLLVSSLCVAVPGLNPEPIGATRLFWLVLHPGFVRATMNIYTNGFHLTPDMRDNSVHWLNLLAQSGFRLQHVDVDSLPVFLDGLLGRRTPAWLYLLPTLAILFLSLGVARLASAHTRCEATLLLTLAASLSFFITYPTVWEYQYTAVLPVAGTLLLLGPGGLLSKTTWRLCAASASCAFLPSLYCFSGSSAPSPTVLTLIRLDRVVPVTLLFLVLVWAVAEATVMQSQKIRSPLRQS